MRTLLISILLIAFVNRGVAQNEYEAVLKEVETNSTTLSALREQMEAQKLGNRTGIYLSNPEFEFAYLWGSPSEIGNRTNINLKQSFDFPTAYGHRNKISKLENNNAELIYKAERMDLLLSAKKICIELAYYNALAKEYEIRLTNAERIAESYKAKLNKGDANIIESNKAQLNLVSVQNEVARIKVERIALLLELKSLNGGKDILFTNNVYSTKIVPTNFEDWYMLAEGKSPVLQYVRGQIDINQQNIKLNKAMSLPQLSAGYMSEKLTDEHFQGVSVGVSIPLWENKNRVKHAKAQAKAAEVALEDNKIQFYNKLKGLHQKAISLQKNALKYRNALSTYSNETLLKKALDLGEISLLNYLLEIEYYYDIVNNILETEKDLELTMAELSAVEL